MAKVTLRVYKAGKKYDGYVDQYSLYYPTPRNKVREWGYKGIYLGFSFSEDRITMCTHDECTLGLGIDTFLGKKVKIETLPQHVQKWIAEEQKAYNTALNLDTQDGWDAYSMNDYKTLYELAKVA